MTAPRPPGPKGREAVVSPFLWSSARSIAHAVSAPASASAPRRVNAVGLSGLAVPVRLPWWPWACRFAARRVPVPVARSKRSPAPAPRGLAPAENRAGLIRTSASIPLWKTG